MYLDMYRLHLYVQECAITFESSILFKDASEFNSSFEKNDSVAPVHVTSLTCGPGFSGGACNPIMQIAAS